MQLTKIFNFLSIESLAFGYKQKEELDLSARV